MCLLLSFCLSSLSLSFTRRRRHTRACLLFLIPSPSSLSLSLPVSQTTRGARGRGSARRREMNDATLDKIEESILLSCWIFRSTRLNIDTSSQLSLLRQRLSLSRPVCLAPTHTRTPALTRYADQVQWISRTAFRTEGQDARRRITRRERGKEAGSHSGSCDHLLSASAAAAAEKCWRRRRKERR